MNENITTASMLRVGTILDGKYRIDRYLSSGGFGNTYVAINEFGEQVAIKEFFLKGINQREENNTTISVSNSENRDQFDQQLAKFKREAKRLRGLNSPYIVKVQSFFEENGTAYYVMDFIDGESLSDWLKRTGQPIPEPEVTRILGQVLEALDETHDQDIRHLDLKPANIMLNRQGQVRLIDFGASKQSDGKGGVTVTTASAFTKGYAPLEQVEGNLDKIGPWTDFYALGATLYRLLTNQTPPQYSDIQDVGPAAFHWPTTVPISQAMRDLIIWMMTPNRANRPQSVTDIRNRMGLTPPPIPVTPHAIESEPTGDVTIIQLGTPSGNNSTADSDGSDNGTGTSSGEKQSKSSFVGRLIGFIAAGVLITLVATRGCTDTTESDSKPQTVTQMLYHSAMGDIRYTGPVDEEGRPHGKGEADWIESKCSYEGYFEHGKMNGECSKYIDPDGNEFVGTMKNNKYIKGTMTMTTGEVYEGSMHNNQPWDGVLTDTEGNKHHYNRGKIE